MNDGEIAEKLDELIAGMGDSPKIKDRRKIKRNGWKNDYAAVVYKHFDKINELITGEYSPLEVCQYFESLGVFTLANYRTFERAYVRECKRREDTHGNKEKLLDTKNVETKRQPTQVFALAGHGNSSNRNDSENLSEPFKPDEED